MTYADLTDEQLWDLHARLHQLPTDKDAVIERGKHSVTIKDSVHETDLSLVDGDVTLHFFAHLSRFCNQFQFFRQCQAWGLNY